MAEDEQARRDDRAGQSAIRHISRPTRSKKASAAGRSTSFDGSGTTSEVEVEAVGGSGADSGVGGACPGIAPPVSAG